MYEWGAMQAGANGYIEITIQNGAQISGADAIDV
jgi:hypothetical protein